MPRSSRFSSGRSSRRWLRRLGWSAAVLALLAGGAWMGLNHYVKDDRIRQLLTDRITAATGRQASIAEPLAVTFSLHPALKISGFSLANADWANDAGASGNSNTAPAMITADALFVQVSLPALLSRQLVVQEVRLDKPRLLLEVNRQGVNNWTFTPAGTPVVDEKSPAPDAPDKAAAPDSFALRVESVTLTDGAVTYHDHRTDTRRTLTLQQLAVQPDGQGLHADMRGSYQDQPYKLNINIKNFQPILQQKGDVPLTLAASFADSTLTAEGTVALDAAAAKKEGLPVRMLQLDIKGDLPTLTALQSFVRRDKPLPDIAPLNFRVAVAGTPERLTLSPLQVQALDSELAGTLTVTPPLNGRTLAVDGTLQLTAASLATLGAGLGQSLAAVPFKLDSGVRLAGQTLRLEPLALHAGDSSLTGNVRVEMPQAGSATGAGPKATPAVTARLHAPLLRLADLSAGTGGDGTGKAAGAASGSGKDAGRDNTGKATPDGQVFSRDPLPLAALRSLRIDITARIDELVLPPKEGTPARSLRDVRLGLVADGQTVCLSDLRAGLPGTGTVTGAARLDIAATPARLTYDLTTSRLTLGQFLKDWGLSDAVTGGVTHLVSHGETTGASLHDWAANVSGETALVIRQMQVKSGVTDFLGGPLAQGLLPGLAEQGGRADQVNCVVTRWPTRVGVMTTDLTLIDTGQLTLAGTGAIQLGAETLHVVLVPQAKAQGLSGLVAPVLIRGPLQKPAVTLDKKAVAGDVVQGVLSGRITTGKPLEVLGQIFGPRGGGAGAGSGDAATPMVDPCSRVLNADDTIREKPLAATSATPPAAAGTDGAVPDADTPASGNGNNILQQLEQRLPGGLNKLLGR
jgi:uncharacterized protein involved in outer membrane biogenesis